MLSEPKDSNGRNARRERRLLQDETRNPESLGCTTCPDRPLCGGLKIEAKSMDCLDLCCRNPQACNSVCRDRVEAFVEHLRDANGLDLSNVPRAPGYPNLDLPLVVPVFYHGNARAEDYAATPVCLPFFKLLTSGGGLKFVSEAKLRRHFKLAAGVPLLLSATAKDRFIEAWWELGSSRRTELIKALRGLGISWVTTPNYSLFTDRPRWDDMHNMKRIAVVWAEFHHGGLPAALHVNSRTERDAERWAEFIHARPEVSSIAFEFGTGAGWGHRRALHTRRLVEIADHVGRPLQLLVRGAGDRLPELRRGFDRVTLLDTTAFMRTMFRLRADGSGNGPLSWPKVTTALGVPLDDRLLHNVAALQRALG